MSNAALAERASIAKETSFATSVGVQYCMKDRQAAGFLESKNRLTRELSAGLRQKTSGTRKITGETMVRLTSAKDFEELNSSENKPGTGNPLHTQEPVTVASFRTWRGWRECVARDRCLTLFILTKCDDLRLRPPRPPLPFYRQLSNNRNTCLRQRNRAR
jgi:hypothetical protein